MAGRLRSPCSSRPALDVPGTVGVIIIMDDGMGMDPETMRRSFEQFYRSDHARRLVPDGSGVGLYAAHGLMRAMGGDIEIASRLGVGTTVTLTLPAESALDDADLRIAQTERCVGRYEGTVVVRAGRNQPARARARCARYRDASSNYFN